MTVQKLFRWVASAAIVAFATLGSSAMAWEMSGTKTLSLHSRDGQISPIGTVTFTPQGDKVAFAVKMDHSKLKDFFLSMREFKCLEAPVEVECYAPYPYANPGTVTVTDLAWLEHSLLFLFKLPKDFGAKWWNGLYYKLKLTDKGLVGMPEAIDLNLISAPSAKFTTPPYGPAQRSEIAPDTRWFTKLTIE